MQLSYVLSHPLSFPRKCSPLESQTCATATSRLWGRRSPVPAVVAPACQPITNVPTVPPEKVELLRSLGGWVGENILPLLKPVEKSWQPQDFLPDSSLPSDEFMEQVLSLRERTAGLPDEYLVILVGDLITEEALPSYTSFLNRFKGIKDPTGTSPDGWSVWIRSWTAEENRHGDLLNKYLYLSGRVNMHMVERTIQNLIISGMSPGLKATPHMAITYTSFQERATFITHGKTASLAKQSGDPVLASICGTIAADEKRHEKAYQRMMEKLLEVDPTDAMLAIADTLGQNITMPAHLMFDGENSNLFNHFSIVTQKLGVYTIADYLDILEFLIGRWKLEKVVGLNSEAQKAQDLVCGLPRKVRKLQEWAEERAQKMKPQTLHFSWIFNKEVTV